MTQNKQWLINGNPRGRALALSDFKQHERTLEPLREGEIRVRVIWLGFDPSQKGQLENVSGYASGNDIGNVMPARGIGEVVESNHPKVPTGATVMGPMGWQ